MVLQNRVKYFIHNYFDSPSQVPHYYTKRLSYFLLILWQFLHSMQMSSCWGHPNMEDPKSYLCLSGVLRVLQNKINGKYFTFFFIIFKRDLPRTYWLDLVHLVIFFRHSGRLVYVFTSLYPDYPWLILPMIHLCYWSIERWRRTGGEEDTGIVTRDTGLTLL